jgi:signal peptidase I
LATVITALILALVAKPYAVPSGSMAQTLEPGDVVLINRLAYAASEPTTGDIIVFDADATWGAVADEGPLRRVLRWIGEATGFGPTGQHTLIKRVIAGPGQRVSCCAEDGSIMVDGVPLDEQYVSNDLEFEAGVLDCNTEPKSRRCLSDVVVPADAFLVLGDNRAASSDSALHCRTDQPAADCWRWAKRVEIVGRAIATLWPPTNWEGY